MPPSVSDAFAAIVATLASPAVGGVIVTLIGLLLADFVTAIAAAARHDQFESLRLADFLRTHVLGAWLPLIALIVFSTFCEPLVAVVALGVTAYTVQTLASIKANLDLASTPHEEPEPDASSK